MDHSPLIDVFTAGPSQEVSLITCLLARIIYGDAYYISTYRIGSVVLVFYIRSGRRGALPLEAPIVELNHP
jgi:hypothetical protein